MKTKDIIQLLSPGNKVQFLDAYRKNEDGFPLRYPYPLVFDDDVVRVVAFRNRVLSIYVKHNSSRGGV